MNIKQCESFLKLAERKSFSIAAQELFISKQGLSRAIQSLETELEVQLFQRTSYGTELSSAGKAVLPEMQEMVRQYRKMKGKLHKIGGGALKLLFPDCFFACVSSDVIFSFIEAHKGIQFDYVCCCDRDVEARLLQGDIDLAICSNPERKADIHYQPLFKNYRCLVVNSKDPLATKPFVRPVDLVNTTIAMAPPEQYNDYRYLKKLFRSLDALPKTVVCYSNDSLLQFAADGHGAALTVTSLTEPPPNNNLRYVFFDQSCSPGYDVNILTVNGRKSSREARSFVRHIQDYCRRELEKQPHFPFGQTPDPTPDSAHPGSSGPAKSTCILGGTYEH